MIQQRIDLNEKIQKIDIVRKVEIATSTRKLIGPDLINKKTGIDGEQS